MKVSSYLKPFKLLGLSGLAWDKQILIYIILCVLPCFTHASALLSYGDLDIKFDDKVPHF